MTEISTRERAGAFDALETAKPGEPIFVVQGGDEFGPATVNFWAGLMREAAMRADKREDAVAKFRKATNAEEVAWEMREYQRFLDHARDGRAASVEAPKGCNGVEPDADRPWIAQLSALADRIYNAIAELNDAAEALGAIGGHAAGELKLRDAIVAAGEGVRLVEPRRHLPRADEETRELERIAAADTMIDEPFRRRRDRLADTVPHDETRLSAVREALALAGDYEVVMIAGIAFTIEEVQLIEREMVPA